MVSATQVLVWIDVGWACQGVFLDAGYSTEGDDETRSVWGFGTVRPIGCHFKAWMVH